MSGGEPLSGPDHPDKPDDEGDDQERKPCGEYHPLPCGLDRACAEGDD